MFELFHAVFQCFKASIGCKRTLMGPVRSHNERGEAFRKDSNDAP